MDTLIDDDPYHSQGTKQKPLSLVDDRGNKDQHVVDNSGMPFSHWYLWARKMTVAELFHTWDKIRVCFPNRTVVELVSDSKAISIAEPSNLRRRLLVERSDEGIQGFLDEKSCGCEQAHLLQQINICQIPFSNEIQFKTRYSSSIFWFDDM